MHLAINEQNYAFARYTNNKTVIVAFNNSPQPETIEAEVPRALKLNDGTVLKNVLGSGAEVKIENGKIKFMLAPRAAVIFS